MKACKSPGLQNNSTQLTSLSSFFPQTARYKPRLQIIIDDIITITEVAELSIEADNIANVIGIDKGDSDSVDHETYEPTESTARRKGPFSAIKWSDIKFQEEHLSNGDSEADELASLGENQSDDGSSKKIDLEFDTPDHQLFQNQKFRGTSTGTSVRLAMKGMLDKWDEPFVKGEKVRTMYFFPIVIFYFTPSSNTCVIFPPLVARFIYSRHNEIQTGPKLYEPRLSLFRSFRAGIYTK